MQSLRSVTMAAGLLLLTAGSAWAHHASAAEFDGSKPVTLTGTITKVEWVNPHAWIPIDVTGPDGQVVTWKVEGGSPNVLVRRGLDRTVLLPGTVIVVEGARARDGTPRVNGRRITLADGRMLFLDLTPDETPTPPPAR